MGLAQESALGTRADSGAKGLRTLGRERHLQQPQQVLVSMTD